jgi:hypothetical protein
MMAASRKGREKTGDTEGAVELLTAAITSAFGALDKLIPEIEPTKPPVLQMLTFTDVVRYFAEHQPRDFEVQGGALLRRPSARGTRMYQLFLDQRDSPCVDKGGRPYGRVFEAMTIDDELATKFGSSDLIIFR